MQVKKYDINTTKKVNEQEIAVLSNIYLSDKISKDKLYSLLDELDIIKPDKILIPGNLYSIDQMTMERELVTQFIDNLTSISDVFYVRGESEEQEKTLPHSLNFYKNQKFHFLCEDTKVNNYCMSFHLDGVNVGGIKLPKNFYTLSELEKIKLILNDYRSYIKSFVELCSNENFNILLCNDPILVELAPAFKQLSLFDLVVSSSQERSFYSETINIILQAFGIHLKNTINNFVEKGKIDYHYPTTNSNEYGYINDDKTYYLQGSGITKFHSEYGEFQKVEKLNEGTIDLVRVRKVEPVRIYGGVFK